MEYQLQFIFFFILILVYNFKYLHPSIRYTSYYLITSGLIASFFPSIMVHFVPDKMGLFAIGNVCSREMMFLLVMLMIPRSRFILKAIPHLIMINSLIILYHWHMGINPWGMGMNSSMDGTLMAIAFPIVLSRLPGKSLFKYIYILLPIIATFATGSSIGIGGIILSSLIMYFDERPSMRDSLIAFVLVSIIIYSSYHINPKFFSDSKRVVCWVWSMDYWWDHANHWIGLGLGSFKVIGPYIQLVTNNEVNNWYVDMHNDWLQVIFETGFIGLILCLISAGFILYRSTKHTWLFSSVLTYLICSLVNYPSRGIATAALAMVLINECLDSTDSRGLV